MNVCQPSQSHAVNAWIDGMNAAVTEHELTPAARMGASEIPSPEILKLELVVRMGRRGDDHEVVVRGFYSRLTHVIIDMVVVEVTVIGEVPLAKQVRMHKLLANEK